MINGPTSLACLAPEKGARLIRLDPSGGYIPIVITNRVAPERAEALLDLLTRATAETMGCVPGFFSGNFHINLDRTPLKWSDVRRSRP